MFYWIVKILSWPIFYIAFLFPTIKDMKKNYLRKDAAIVITNHTALYDPAFMIWMLPRKIHFLAKNELFNSKLKKLFFKGMETISVNRDGNDLASLMNAINVLKKGELLGICPEGTRSKTGRMLPFEKGVAYMALRTKAPVIPVGISTRPRIFHRPKLIMGEPMTFEQYYDQRITSDNVLDVTKKLEITVKRLVDQANA